jgi:hypothetical protein
MPKPLASTTALGHEKPDRRAIGFVRMMLILLTGPL